MIHSFQVYRQYLKHMDGVRAAINNSAPVLHSRSGAPFQPVSIYLLMKSKPLSLRNDEISEMQRDNNSGPVLK